MPNFLTVVESQNFEADRARISNDIRRMDEILQGVYWVLSREPFRGKQTSANNIWAITTRSVQDIPSLAIYYTFNEEQVILLSVVPSYNVSQVEINMVC